MSNVFFETTDLLTSGDTLSIADGDFLDIEQGVHITSTAGFAVAASGGSMIVQVDGYLAGDWGVILQAGTTSGDNTILVTQLGSISTFQVAIEETIAGAQGDIIDNYGQIMSSANIAILLANAGNSISNYGAISSANQSAINIAQGQNLIENDGSISAPHVNASGIFVADGLNIITNNGSVSAGYDGIGVQGLGGNYVSNSGVISAAISGIVLNGSDNAVSNSGTITAITGDAIILVAGSSSVTNTGTISSSYGSALSLTGGGNTITNSGILSGADSTLATVMLDSAPGEANSLFNSGQILGGVFAVFGGAGSDTVVNIGTLDGNVELGGGNDVYQGRFGTTTGGIDGGNGNDILKGGMGDDNLFGGSGNDTLRGGGGDNIFAGAAGADLISALGDGNDSFVYSAVSDSTSKTYDTIKYFDPDRDAFDLSVTVKAIDAAVTSGTLNSGSTFDATLAAAVGSTQLKAHHAMMFAANLGTLAGHTFLVVDANGTAGYQASADYVFELSHGTNLGDLAIGDFI